MQKIIQIELFVSKIKHGQIGESTQKEYVIAKYSKRKEGLP